MQNTFRIIKKSTAPKLSPTATGALTYHVASDAPDATPASTYLRITANSAGGFFSNEWICLDDILNTISENDSDTTFKAITFKHLYQSKGTNNHGFLAAALRAEKILLPVDKKVMSHTLGDPEPFLKTMQKLIKDKIDLEDDVAVEEAIKEAKRAEMIKNMKKAHKANSKK